MFCRKCGTQLSDDDNFCFNCGTPVENKTEQIPQEEPKETKNEEKDFDEFLDLDVDSFDEEDLIWEEVPIDEQLDITPTKTETPKVETKAETSDKPKSSPKSAKSTIANPIKPKTTKQQPVDEQVVVSKDDEDIIILPDSEEAEIEISNDDDTIIADDTIISDDDMILDDDDTLMDDDFLVEELPDKPQVDEVASPDMS